MSRGASRGAPVILELTASEARVVRAVLERVGVHDGWRWGPGGEWTRSQRILAVDVMRRLEAITPERPAHRGRRQRGAGLSRAEEL